MTDYSAKHDITALRRTVAKLERRVAELEKQAKVQPSVPEWAGKVEAADDLPPEDLRAR